MLKIHWRTGVCAFALALAAAGCQESDAVGSADGIGSDAVSDVHTGSPSDIGAPTGDVGPPDDIAQSNDSTQPGTDAGTPTIAPGASLGGPGNIAESANYRMVSTLGSPLGSPMSAESKSYRMTTSLLALEGANP